MQKQSILFLDKRGYVGFYYISYLKAEFKFLFPFIFTYYYIYMLPKRTCLIVFIKYVSYESSK